MHFLEGDYYYTKLFWPTTSFITLVTYKNIIYDIGTKILNLQCFNFPQNQLFCKSIIVCASRIPPTPSLARVYVEVVLRNA